MDLAALPKQLLGKTSPLTLAGSPGAVTAQGPDGKPVTGQLHVDDNGVVRFVPGTPS